MAVSIASISGSAAHGGTLIISGSGFGTKPGVTPVVWDNCSGTRITDLWSGGWPSRGTVNYQLQYRDAPYRGIAAPHNRVGRYMTGAHGDSNGYDAGYNVMVFRSRTISFPAYSYASWYQRCDDNWVFTGDSNFKCYDYSRGTEPYDLPNNWYTEYNPRPTSRTATPSWHANDDNGSFSGGYPWGQNAVNPMSGVWTKVEHYVEISNLTGFIKVYENGQLKLNMTTRTDAMSGNIRCDAIGGFSRSYGQPNNWRYFADLYLDYTLQHVSFGNASTIDACTVLEVQPTTAWSPTSITATVNRGTFSDGQNVYLYVFDEAGTANASGLLVGMGTPPAAPTNLQVR